MVTALLWTHSGCGWGGPAAENSGTPEHAIYTAFKSASSASTRQKAQPHTPPYLSLWVFRAQAGSTQLHHLRQAGDGGHGGLGSLRQLLLAGRGVLHQHLGVLHQRLGCLQDALPGEKKGVREGCLRKNREASACTRAPCSLPSICMSWRGKTAGTTRTRRSPWG